MTNRITLHLSMRNPYRKIISLLMLASFVVVSLGAYGFSSRWFVHQIDHDQHLFAADHTHALPFEIDGNSKLQPLSDIEHALLHALTHFESAPNSTLDELAQPPAQITPLLPPQRSVPLMATESLFRPPRITAPI